ncbi:MAG: hypothetical protein ACK5R4_01500 [Alphaproteobacteria bacterium]
MQPKTPISPAIHVPQGATPDHGLDPEYEKFRTRLALGQNDARSFYAVTLELPPIGSDTKNWAESIAWAELGTLSLEDDIGGSSATSGSADPLQLSPELRLKTLSVRRFFNIRTAFDRALESESCFDCDLPREALETARQLAKDALAAILPMQAYLFIPPDELAKAQADAERIAREFAGDCLKHARKDSEEAKKSLKSGEIKSSLGKRLRKLSERHDGRYHIFPYSQLHAPETGIATIAIIESRHQSITGDHGRVRMTTTSSFPS